MRRVFWLLQSSLLVSVWAVQLHADAIYGNAGIGSATISLTGAETLSAMSDSKGEYVFARLPPGKYILTPKLSGYTFSPASQSVALSTSVVAVSFTATETITETNLEATPASIALTAPGVTYQLTVEATYSNDASSNVTKSATYSSNSTSVATVSQSGLITAVGPGKATVIASYGGLSSSVAISVNPPATYSISGSAGAASVTVALSGTADANVTASSSGAFSFSNLTSGSYTITPSLAGYTFSPVSQSIAITNANVSGVNFTATTTAHSVDLSWGAGSIENPAAGQVVAGYNVYRSSASGGPYTKLNSSPVAALTYVDTAVSAGETLYYVCSTVDNLGNVSKYSNQATATVP
jgi:Bacterial Ig-like domain (group 2)